MRALVRQSPSEGKSPLQRTIGRGGARLEDMDCGAERMVGRAPDGKFCRRALAEALGEALIREGRCECLPGFD